MTSAVSSPTISYALRPSPVASAEIPSVDADQFDTVVEEQWFSATVERKRMKALMQRSDAAGWRHFGLWFALLIGSFVGVLTTWFSWRTIPFLAVYGITYSMSDHHAHELSHGTPFKNRKINEVLYRMNAFMTLHEAHYWRWSHTRHHTNTLMVGLDPEIAVQRPPKLWRVALDFFFLPAGIGQIRNLISISISGRIKGDGEYFVPESERSKIVRNSRIYLVLLLSVVGASVLTWSVLPAVLFVTPRFWGGPFAQLFNITQHAGLPEEVFDHRLNCRTIVMNPVFRFMYMNMNYHLEHHMFPMVPFYSLPALHEEIKSQCPPPYRGVREAYREMLPAVRTQVTNPDFFVQRAIPVE
jgi:fatty acid desaturase